MIFARAIIVVVVSLCLPATLFASSFEFVAQSALAHVGDTVQIPVYVNSEGVSAFVAQANIIFSKNLLWVKSFTLAPGWLPVSGEEYQFLDNGRGALRKTAGFEGGVSGRVLFGNVEGIITRNGDAEIYADSSSFILNKENKNVFQEGKSARLKVAEAPSRGNIPPSLFDIRLDVATSVIAPAESLVARVLFQSFGNVPTPVDMFFTITDDAGKVFTSFQGSTVVETESVFTKQFDGLNLPVGNYILHVSTRYKADVMDEFSAPFSVESGAQLPWVIGVMIFTISVVATAFFLWRKQV